MTALTVIHVLASFFLVTVILLQAGKADMGIGFGSSSQSIFGSKGAGNFLTKTTTVIAVLFLLTSFLLTKLQLNEHRSSVIKNELSPTQPGQSPAKPKSESPAPGKVDGKGADTDSKTK